MHSLLWLNTVLVCICSFWGLVWGSFSCAFSGMTKAWSFVEHGCDLRSNDILFKAEIWRQISWIHQILMLESRNFSTLEGSLILKGLTCPHCSWHESNLLYLTVEIAPLCFLNKSLVITGRFDGPSLILTLSAVKHLGKDNNSQFYDTVRGRRGVFFSASLIFQNSPKEECSLPRTTQESSSPLKSTRSLNKWSQVIFWCV